jgi:hypothetical protein
MSFDPALWRESFRGPILGALVAVMAVTIALSPRSVVAVVVAAVIPAVVGGSIWRFDHLSWTDILSWTAPLAVWSAAVISILPSLGSVGWILGGISVAGWVYAFVFWTPVTGWWYRSVLRKPYPGSGADSALRDIPRR